MNTTVRDSSRPPLTRTILVVVSLAMLIVAGTVTASAADYDPTKPTSSRENANPPGGSGGGGGGGGGGGARPDIALGISMEGSRDMDTLSSMTADLGGHQPSLWGIWSPWGMADLKAFPTGVMNQLRDRGVVPFVFWEPWDRDDPSDPQFRLARIAAGEHDAYIRGWARDAKAYGGLVLLRFAHEANGGYFPWTVKNSLLGNTVADYVAAWRHVWDIFHQEGADNVKFVWSLAKQTCSGGCNPYAEFYPGGQYVDYMAFTSFNWGDSNGRVWQSMYEGYRQTATKLGEISNKPIIVAETGSNTVGGDKAAWIRQGYPEVYEKLPQIIAILWLNVDLRGVGHPDWRISSPPEALAAYRAIAGDPRFDGKVTLKGPRIDKVGRVKARKHTAKQETTSAPARTKKAPEVHVGSAVPSESSPKKDLKANRARTTKHKTKENEAPSTLDLFER